MNVAMLAKERCKILQAPHSKENRQRIAKQTEKFHSLYRLLIHTAHTMEDNQFISLYYEGTVNIMIIKTEFGFYTIVNGVPYEQLRLGDACEYAVKLLS